ncbi:zinc knuckle domain protein [Penicillium herquei]|nr:zinc knuckle domain protein [Penicillium herquei]
MATFLRDKQALDTDVIAVQEPWNNQKNNTTHQPAGRTFQLVFPRYSDKEIPGVCLYVSKKIDPATWSCQQISVDYQILKLRRQLGHGWTDVFVHNIYNRVGSGLPLRLRTELQKRKEAEHIVIGDFNLHHPATDPEAEDLLLISDESCLALITEEGRATWQRGERSSVIDLTFISDSLVDRLIYNERGIEHQSDHYPIITEIDISTSQFTPPQRRNWKELDTKALTSYIEHHMTVRDMPMATSEEIEVELTIFMAVIQSAIEQAVPWARPSAWSNPDFTPECAEAVATARRLRRKYSATHDPVDWERYTQARNQKNRIIQRAMGKAHRQRVQKAIENGLSGLWKLSKWARNRTGAYEKGVTPAIKHGEGLAETVETKATAFQQAFFPQPPLADLSDIQDFRYPSNPINFPPITRHEILNVISDVPGDKAPGEDSIPNSFWKIASQIPSVLDMLYQMFNACLRTGYNPTHFQRSITVVLRKAGDRDYQLAKSYRPVALLNTIAKLLEAVVARRISYAAETYKLLPNGHLGGRKGISTDHAIQTILDTIRKAWGHHRVVSMLFLDVSGAYDNVSHQRLLHNLRKRRLGQLVPWVQSFLTGRSTRIRLPEGISDEIPTPTGIPQGSPISPILYLFYNADLIQTKGVTAQGWVDDVCFATESRTVATNIRKLQKACDLANQWAHRHASVFDLKKYTLIHFEQGTTGSDLPLVVRTATGRYTISPSTESAERYLGFWLDRKLTFKDHQAKALIKANTTLQALRSLAGSTWGASVSAMRRIYLAVVLPQMLYGVAAWYSPLTTGIQQANKMSHPFAAIQKRAACLIAGAFKTSAAAALNVELHLPPIDIQMNRIVKETALRLRTGPRFAIPPSMKNKQRSTRQRLTGGWSPMEAQAWKKGGCLTAPPETLAGRWESRKAYIRAPWQAPPTVIIEDREKAVKSHDEIMAKVLGYGLPLVFFTDGSGYQGHVGAAAMTDSPGETLQSQMGTDSISTVYSAEIRAAEMALEAAANMEPNDKPGDDPYQRLKDGGLVIFSDSQAALKAIKTPRMPSGQIYLEGCLRLVDKLQEQYPSCPVELRWIPAHQGVTFNEMVDFQAKEAALQPLKKCVRLAAAAKRGIRSEAKLAWERAWARERAGQATKRLLESPTKRVLDFWSGQRKATSTIMIQLRTGIIGLNQYLWKIKIRPSPQCACGLGKQSPKHVLLECPIFAEQRLEMRRELVQKRVSLNLRFDELIQQRPAVTAITKFVESTRLLGQFHNVDPQAMGMEPAEDAEEAMEGEP